MSPLPRTTDVGKIMRELKTGRKRPRKQMIAIALAHARKMGAKIPEAPKRKKGSSNPGRIKTAKWF